MAATDAADNYWGSRAQHAVTLADAEEAVQEALLAFLGKFD